MFSYNCIYFGSSTFSALKKRATELSESLSETPGSAQTVPCLRIICTLTPLAGVFNKVTAGVLPVTENSAGAVISASGLS